MKEMLWLFMAICVWSFFNSLLEKKYHDAVVSVSVFIFLLIAIAVQSTKVVVIP